MKKIYLALVAVVVALSMSSCVTVSGLSGMSDGTAISNANFTYVNTVQATAETSIYLGLFGGNNSEQMVIDQLRSKANLKDGQVLTNIRITTEEQYVLMGIIINKTVRGTADVVEFKK